MKNSEGAPGCPYIHTSNDVVYSTNAPFWQDFRINSRAMAANLRSATVGDDETFVPWFEPDAELSTAVNLRKKYFKTDPNRILHTGTHNHVAMYLAALELLELQIDYLESTYPEYYTTRTVPFLGKVAINTTTHDAYRIGAGESELHPLAISGLLGQEDICMVQKTDDGRHELSAGFVANPTDWNLSSLIDKDMDEIHEDFPGYNERLKSVVDGTLENLEEFPVMKYRNNIFLDYKPTLALFPENNPLNDAKYIADPGSEISIRSERETLVRLPRSRDVVFTIKPQTISLATAIETFDEQKLKKLIEAVQKNTVLNRNELLAELALGYLCSEHDSI